MASEGSRFLRALSRKPHENIPIYCTGYPESEFLEKWVDTIEGYPTNDEDLILNGRNYSHIAQMGFDAISIWDYRRGEGGYELNSELRVDGWGRIYKRDWYAWEGVFKDEDVINNWEHLNLPSREKLNDLNDFLRGTKNIIIPVLSLPGLFEKTWQSMGFLFFAKCLRNNLPLIKKVISFFANYLRDLIEVLQGVGASTFIIADDCAYKKHEFMPKDLWNELFFDKYEKIVRSVHDKGHKVIIHSDGFISNLIQTFIDIGFDGVQSLEPSAGVDLLSLLEQFSKKICFIGNLDMSQLIYGTPEQIKTYTHELIQKAIETKNSLIISPTQQIHSKISVENVKMMIDSTKSFRINI